MGIRFRKSIKLGKHTRINVNKKSVGFSFGSKGFRKSFNTSGRRTTTYSIPGTGLSYVDTKYKKETSSQKGKKRNASNNNASVMSLLFIGVLFAVFCSVIFFGCSKDSSKKQNTTVSSKSDSTTTTSTTTTKTETTTSASSTQQSTSKGTDASTQSNSTEATKQAIVTTQETETKSSFVLNSGTMKAHCPGCSSIEKIKSGNKKDFSGTVEQLKQMGYSPCGKCRPW